MQRVCQCICEVQTQDTFFVTKEVASQMELDGTSTLEFELVIIRQHSNNISWVLGRNRKIVDVDGDVLVAIIDSTHPDAWVSKKRKVSHVSQAQQELLRPSQSTRP